jgi:hypothetical protein
MTHIFHVHVPDAAVSCIVGSGGVVIQELMQRSGAHITITENGEYAQGTSNRIVSITGSQQSAEQALALVLPKIPGKGKRCKYFALGGCPNLKCQFIHIEERVNSKATPTFASQNPILPKPTATAPTSLSSKATTRRQLQSGEGSPDVPHRLEHKGAGGTSSDRLVVAHGGLKTQTPCKSPGNLTVTFKSTGGGSALEVPTEYKGIIGEREAHVRACTCQACSYRVKRPEIKCSYGSKCSQRDCRFRHPSPSYSGSTKRLAGDEIRMCRFRILCTDNKCEFAHPPPALKCCARRHEAPASMLVCVCMYIICMYVTSSLRPHTPQGERRKVEPKRRGCRLSSLRCTLSAPVYICVSAYCYICVCILQYTLSIQLLEAEVHVISYKRVMLN